jgi:hypothetical protein
MCLLCELIDQSKDGVVVLSHCMGNEVSECLDVLDKSSLTRHRLQIIDLSSTGALVTGSNLSNEDTKDWPRFPILGE